MFVREILLHKGADVKRATPDDPLEEAAALMRLERIGALVVCDQQQRLLGILSEKDLVRAIADCGSRALGMKVSDFMETRVVTCSADDSVARLAKLMTQHRTRHVPVVEGDRVRGLISIGDVVKNRFEEMELERDTLRDIAQSRQLAT